MTKHFCDICGSEAIDRPAALTGMNAGGEWIGPVDRRFQPQVVASTCFEILNGRPPSDRNQPADICKKCRHDLLVKLAEKYTP
jgi:rRNA maturation endonuclease Nob1